MTREFLRKLGITDESVIDKILDENSSDIGEIKSEKQKLKDQTDELTKTNLSYKTKVAELEKSLAESKSGKETTDSEMASLKKELDAYKAKDLKTRIAVEVGVPIQLAEKLTGENEDALRTDAETLVKYLKPQEQELPLRTTEPEVLVGTDGAYKQLLENLKEK
ncbi:MAG: hypothetical protein Q4E09_06020 [Eubacteriales bacterium]|nr:hypothetical protein [Eubacteriales bacterium]